MYFDNAATTPLLPEVKEEIIKYLDYYGNPSSQHKDGYIIKNKIEEIRDDIANIFCNNSRKIVFTSSGSASNNLVIRGLNDDYMYLYTPTSHKSMLMSCKSKIFNQEIKVDKEGLIDIRKLQKQLEKYSSLRKPVVCYEMANSELGIYQEAEAIAELVHSFGGIIVADLTAYMPHLPLVNPCKLADFYTFSAHKLGALKGVGVVVINCFEKVSPLIYGAQELGLFGGTENVIGIISLGAALKALNIKEKNKFDRMSHFFQDMIKRNIPDSYIISENCPYKIPQIMTICFKNVSGEELVHMMDNEGFSISTGSACNSGSLEPSYTLTAIKLCKDDIPCCVRISFSGNEQLDEVMALGNKLKEVVKILRELQ